jgi:hypothetical protein
VNNLERIRLKRIVEFSCDLVMKASLMELRAQETVVHKICDCTLVVLRNNTLHNQDCAILEYLIFDMMLK